MTRLFICVGDNEDSTKFLNSINHWPWVLLLRDRELVNDRKTLNC